MRARSFSRLALGALLSVLSACHHDIHALQKDLGSAGSVSIFDAGQSQTDSGTSQPKMDAGALSSCAPCSEPPMVSGSAVMGHACCAGTHGSVCGAAFATGQRCYERDVPGSVDTLCPDAKHAGKTFAGCCRADAQCGVTIDVLGLGCMARADVPPVLGGPLAARACVPLCKSDTDCMAFSDAYICTESAKDKTRFCALSCQRDKDCAGQAGTVCAIQNNIAENRVDAYCRKPFGQGAQGDPCSKPEDCMHGTCAVDRTVTPSRQFCTQLCGGDLDCIGGNTMCQTTSIPLPDGSGSQAFRICLAQ